MEKSWELAVKGRGRRGRACGLFCRAPPDSEREKTFTPPVCLSSWAVPDVRSDRQTIWWWRCPLTSLPRCRTAFICCWPSLCPQVRGYVCLCHFRFIEIPESNKLERIAKILFMFSLFFGVRFFFFALCWFMYLWIIYAVFIEFVDLIFYLLNYQTGQE